LNAAIGHMSVCKYVCSHQRSILLLFNKQGNLAFGKKGRPASAGKPRIPADATITFDVEIVGLPGREEELIEIIGGDI
jgi:hypothetical protein